MSDSPRRDGSAPRPLVMVLGMHRSGTSLCANMLHALGIDMADAPGESPANRRGHWERSRINDLHDQVLAIFGRSWGEPTHHLALPEKWWTDSRLERVRRDIAAFLSPRLAAGGPIGFKDPRTARLLPLWPAILTELHAAPIFVFCVRDPAQVARSVSARDGLAGEQAAYRWLIYNAQAAHSLGAARICVIPYEDWFAAPAETLARLARFVGAAPPAGDLLSIVDAGLRHDTQGAGQAVPSIAATLHSMIAACRATERFPATLLSLANTILGCERAVMPFLREAAVLRVSVSEQNRVIGDMNGLIAQLRHEAAPHMARQN